MPKATTPFQKLAASLAEAVRDASDGEAYITSEEAANALTRFLNDNAVVVTEAADSSPTWSNNTNMMSLFKEGLQRDTALKALTLVHVEDVSGNGHPHHYQGQMIVLNPGSAR